MPDIFIAEKGVPVQLAKNHRKYKYNPLAAFMYYPHKVDFLNKDPEEEVILILRRHPITNLGWIIISILMLFAPAVLNYFPIIAFLPERFQFVAVLGWYMISVAFVFEHFLSWYFNVNIVTDERVFDVDFVNLIYREMTDANIDQIQDVTVKVGSAARTFFNYGNVVIQTAAEIPQIEFEAVPQPDRVARILRELRIEEEQEKLEGRIR
jgi:uncharacterized membrane protein YdbT with pleckstrin-like domain